MAEQKYEMNTALSVWQNSMTSLVVRDYKENNVEFDEYSRECAMSAMSNIYQTVIASGKDINAFSRDGMYDVVKQCASLKLNANTIPKEVFFNVRTKKIGDSYMPTIELGTTVNANLSMLRHFGVNVDTVYDAWLVKEGDEFVYPKRKGLTVTDPEWTPCGKSLKTIRAVVPVKLKDGTVDYLIAERDSVKTNLIAHIKQNLLNETFGICADRYKASDAQKKQIAEKKAEILNPLITCQTLDEMLALESIRPYMSGAWSDTTESMIDTKLVGNAIRKRQKELNPIATTSLVQIDETYKTAQEETEENANTVPFESEVVIESTAKVVEE